MSATAQPALNAAPSVPGAPADPLAALRGYHLPAPPSWWPPAPGWWVLAGLILVLLVLGIWWLRRRQRRRAARHQALDELNQLIRRLEAGDDETGCLRELSRLLKRYAIVTFPGQPVAAMTGEQWLAFLDAHGGGEQFRNGPGRVLLDAPYRPAADGQARQLAGLVGDWIRHNSTPDKPEEGA